jgi:hypothetical protein
MALGLTPLEAFRHSVNGLPVVVVGVPARVAVPLPLSVKVTPVGRDEDLVQPAKLVLVIEFTVGLPDVETVKLPTAPTVNVVLGALLILGASCVVPENCPVATPLVQTVLTVK